MWQINEEKLAQYNRSLLHACENLDIYSVELLLENGANPNLWVNHNGYLARVIEHIGNSKNNYNENDSEIDYKNMDKVIIIYNLLCEYGFEFPPNFKGDVFIGRKVYKKLLPILFESHPHIFNNLESFCSLFKSSVNINLLKYAMNNIFEPFIILKNIEYYSPFLEYCIVNYDTCKEKVDYILELYSDTNLLDKCIKYIIIDNINYSINCMKPYINFLEKYKHKSSYSSKIEEILVHIQNQINNIETSEN